MTKLLTIAIVAAVAAATGGPAQAAGTETAVAAAWHAKATKKQRAATRTYRPTSFRQCAPVGPDPLCPTLPSYNPCNPDRGFCDPGWAYHGNIIGCASDMGYGRWQRCDATR